MGNVIRGIWQGLGSLQAGYPQKIRTKAILFMAPRLSTHSLPSSHSDCSYLSSGELIKLTLKVLTKTLDPKVENKSGVLAAGADLPETWWMIAL